MRSKTEVASVQRARCTHQRGKVLFLSRPMRFLLMVVEHGTASRWWELLGRVGTHWLFLLAFCSLRRYEKSLHSVYLIPPTRYKVIVSGCPLCPYWTPGPGGGSLCTLNSSDVSSLGSHPHQLRGTQARGRVQRGPRQVSEALSPVHEPHNMVCAGHGCTEVQALCRRAAQGGGFREERSLNTQSGFTEVGGGREGISGGAQIAAERRQ